MKQIVAATSFPQLPNGDWLQCQSCMLEFLSVQGSIIFEILFFEFHFCYFFLNCPFDKLKMPEDSSKTSLK